MIYAHTGLPGHGKTLYTLEFVSDLAEKSDRPVYYYGIDDLALDWHLIDDPALWFDLPENSIIVIDEAQKIFPLRPPKTKAPRRCTEFETHRHKGYDIILVTQDIRLIDHHARRLVGNHKHISRKFGSKQAGILEWEGIGSFDDYHSRQKAQKSTWRIKSKFFSAYKSATIHTVKRKIPKAVYISLLMFAVIAYCVYAFVDIIGGGFGAFDLDPADPADPSDPAASIYSPPLPSPAAVIEITAETWAKNWTPRLAGYPASAPVYDGLYAPRSVPILNCIASEDDTVCQCYTEQATRYRNVPHDVCLTAVYDRRYNPMRETKRLSGGRGSAGINSSSFRPVGAYSR